MCAKGRRIDAGNERLKAAIGDCRDDLLSLSELQRIELFTSLLFDRLNDKLSQFDLLFELCDEDWNETLYRLFMSTLGDKKNKEAFAELASRIPYKALLRERSVKGAGEAMLLSASGLLELYPYDDYTLDLRRNFDYLARKYNIEPISPSVWDLDGIRPPNHPVLRLAQAAEFIAQNQFLLERVMQCRSGRDVRDLVSVAASPYWTEHDVPSKKGAKKVKRIGSFKANMIGINFVSILQFAYGSHTENEQLRDSALSLLEQLQPDENSLVNIWIAAGFEPVNAFESQALLQLTNQYCALSECERCPLRRRLPQS